MGIISWIVLGLIVGILAKWILPGKDPGGMIVTIVIGIVGALLDLYRLAVTLSSSPELAGSLTPVWLVRDATLLALSLMIALAGAISWFTLKQWLAFAERAQKEVLGLDRTTNHQGRKGHG